MQSGPEKVESNSGEHMERVSLSSSGENPVENLEHVATKHNAQSSRLSSMVSAPVRAGKWTYEKAASGASWAKDNTVKGAAWAKTKATNGASWAKTKAQGFSLYNFAPYAAVAGASFAARQWIISAVAAAASVVLSPLMVVAGALGFSFAVDKGRQRFKAWEASNYDKKGEVSLDALNLGQCNAFMLGVAAQESYKGQLTACFKWDAIRHGHAYYAGMGAELSKNNALIDDINHRKANLVKPKP